MIMPIPVTSPIRRLSASFALAVMLLAACNANTPQSLIASGKEYSAKNDPAAAAIQYKAALQLDPRSGEARLLLGEALLNAGDIEGAVLELTKALDDKAPAAVVMPLLSRAYVLGGDYKKLVATYGDLVLDDKRAQASLKSSIATAWGALGDRAKTEAAVAAALAAMPDFGPAQVLQARLLAGKRQFDEAAAVVDAVLARDDKFYEAWVLRGELLSFAKQDLKGAEEAFRKALAIERSYVPAHSAIISLRIRQNDIAGAKAQADQLRAVAPKHPFTTLVDAQLAYLDRQPARARELVQKLLRVFPDHQAVLVLGGSIEGELGAVVQAAAYFAKALQLNPSLDVARRNLAETEIRQGQYAKALETLKPMLTASPPKADAMALAGDAELRMGNAAAAEQYFVNAAKLDPSNVRLRTAAAMTRLWSGDASAALADLQALSEKTVDTYVDEALFAARVKRREFDAALATLDRMAKKQPGKAAQHFELRGRVHLARKDLVAARQAFEQAQKADPALFAAVSSLAFIDMAENKPAQAVDRLQAAVGANPKNSVAILALAEMKIRNDAPIADVKKLFADAIIAAPSAPEPRLRLIDFTLRKRQFKDALTAAQDAVAALPGDVSILEAVGQAQMQAGDVEQAASTFRKLASAMPASPAPYMRLAEVYSASGKRDQAEAAINKALELAPGLPSAQAALVDILVSTNRQRNALEYIRRVRQGKPNQFVGYALEASYHARLKDADAAVAVLREGLAKTNSPELASRLYSLLLQAARGPEAEKFAATWIKQHPQDAAFEYLMSTSEIARGDLRSAEQRLRRVLAVYPNNALALNNMAWVLVSTGNPGAVAYARRAVELLPDRPAFMDTLALALAANKQAAAALDVQKRAVELSPDDNSLRLNLAKVALQAGDKVVARQELDRLQKLGAAFSGHAEVSKLRQEL